MTQTFQSGLLTPKQWEAALARWKGPAEEPDKGKDEGKAASESEKEEEKKDSPPPPPKKVRC